MVPKIISGGYLRPTGRMRLNRLWRIQEEVGGGKYSKKIAACNFPSGFRARFLKSGSLLNSSKSVRTVGGF